MKRIGTLVTLCICLLLAASAMASGLTAEDLAAAKGMTEAFQKAVNAGDWKAVAALYGEDALLLPPNAPGVRGRAAIGEFFAAFPHVTDLVCQDLAIHGCADMVYTTGTYTMTIHPEGMDPIQEEGKYLDVKRKQADGTWLYEADMFNSSLPAAE